MKHRLVMFLALSGVLVATGCRKSRGTSTISDSTYAATMAELRVIARDTMLDSASQDSARVRTLARHHVTAAGMQQAAHVLASDPDHAIAVWKMITEHSAPSKRPAASSK